MEFVRRQSRLGSTFALDALADAFASFRAHYNVRPERGVCAPDVYARLAELFEGTEAAAHRQSTRVAYDGVAIVAGIVAPGTLVFEGHVDEITMGDW